MSAPKKYKYNVFVQRAYYGSPDGQNVADVTALIINLITTGNTSVIADNQHMGGDPCVGTVKELHVLWQVGPMFTDIVDRNCSEHDTLDLTPPGASDLTSPSAA